MYNFYKERLCSSIPGFLTKYLESPAIARLKKVGYFCGMDYASKDIYDFSEYISRYDHSLSVALLVYKLTGNEVMSLSGLFHDIGTPCFSHVIDYMNEDFENQESTEAYTLNVFSSDRYLVECLKSDGISISNVIDFKKYPIVDNDRPKVCADRIDGLILTAIGWTQNISYCDIINIVNDMEIYTNEFSEPEIGFKSKEVANQVVRISETIDEYCHSDSDNYMMLLLSKITKTALEMGLVSERDLYRLNEEELFGILGARNELKDMLYEFKHIKEEDIPVTKLKVKKRNLNPIVNGVRSRI